jgi:DNA-directed RNA polymerase
MHDVLEYNIPDPTISSKIPRVIGGLPTATSVDATDIIKKENYGKLIDDWKFENKEDFFRYNRDKEEMEVKLDADASRRLSINLTISTANKVLDYDKIYFVYSLDYRGRVYATSPFLSPQGPSYSKSLLEFAEGQYLDDKGLEWLKVHIANEYGHDKLPYDERIQWVDNNINYIYDAGHKPMDHISFWAYADKPYEFLAACFGMYDYMNEQPVHVGVQLDATCSGIQIYSGLLLDEVGAKAVNVVGDTRNDIYQQVADKVNHYLHTGDYPATYEFKDKEGVERVVETKEEAESLAGKITRKLTKRNTMTLPYSVTLRGMYDQLREEFKDARIQGKIFWEGDEWIATKLLADLNHRAIYEVVEGARLGQEYLKEVGSNLADTDKIVEYTTPLYNFKVVQRSFKQIKKRVKTYFGSLVLRNNTSDVDRRSQVNGIAPNVVHSLDATLLYLTVEKQIGAVGTNHDCFTVPPNDAEVLRDNFRIAYKELMECSPLAYIGKQLDDTVEVPHIGTLDLDDVLDAQYIIS